MTTKTPNDELELAMQEDIARALQAIPQAERSVSNMAAAVTRVLETYLSPPDIRVQAEACSDREFHVTITILPSQCSFSGILVSEDES